MEDILQNQAVQTYFLETDIYDKLEEVAKKHKLPVERTGELLALSDAVIKGKIDFQQMPEFIAQAFGIDEQRAKLVSADVAGHHLLPLENYIFGIRGQIKEWGGLIEDYPEKRIGGKMTDEDRFMSEFANKLDLNLPGHLMNRFIYLFRGYLSKKRAREATLELMMRRLNIGGLELTKDQAEKALQILDGESERFSKAVGKKIQPEAGIEKLEIGNSKLEIGNEKKEVYKKTKEVIADDAEVSHGAEEVIQDAKEVINETEPTSKIQEPIISKAEIVKELKAEIQEVGEPRIVGRKIVPEKVLEVSKTEEVKKSEPKIAKVLVEKPEPKKELLFQEKPKVEQGDRDMANLILKPVVTVFRSKHIPRRAYRVSVGAYMRGQEGEEELLGTFKDYDFSEEEIAKCLDIVKKARRVLRGEEKGGEKLEIGNSKLKIEKKEIIKNSRLPVRALSHSLTKEVPIISGSILDEDEEEDLAVHAKKTQKISSKVEEKIDPEVQQKINQELVPVVQIFKKKKIKKQIFEDIVRAHIRGMRETLQTRKLLSENHGLEGDDLDIVIKALDSARGISNQKPNQISIQTQTQASNTQKREQELLNKRHAEITNTTASTKIETEKLGARVSASRTKEEELRLQEQKISEQKLKTAELTSKPVPAKAKLSIQSVAPGESKFTDVKFARRLAGPVEELGRMDVSSFRRLSSDPKEAVMKIEDKLDLVAETAYEERIRGVRAWRLSPLSKLYLEMTRESLKKCVSMAEIATMRRNAGEETLSPAEITAIASLNNRIKF